MLLIKKITVIFYRLSSVIQNRSHIHAAHTQVQMHYTNILCWQLYNPVNYHITDEA
jgi:hypothetical protein